MIVSNLPTGFLLTISIGQFHNISTLTSKFGNIAIVGKTTTSMIFFLDNNYHVILGIQLVFIRDLSLRRFQVRTNSNMARGKRKKCSHPTVI
jgi:hypothetical protein